ncbi:transcription termination/antitermination protein NusG [Nocardia asiatica]|uniref:transcription termination/antitermination protein NusG n=1 Tax=Nocardia asiatica TaxID=209252 RepID=UPI003EE39717
MVEFQVGHRVVITDGTFSTLEATVDELGENSTTAMGTLELFGRVMRVVLSADPESDMTVTADIDRSKLIAKYATATRFYGVVGRIVLGSRAGCYIRVDKYKDLAETPEERADATGGLIRIAADPGMEIDCSGEVVEDWAEVEEALLRDGHQVDWNWADPGMSTSSTLQ